MNINSENRLLYFRVASRVLDLANRYVDDGILLDYEGVEIPLNTEQQPAQVELVPQLVPQNSPVITIETLIEQLLDFARKEYVEAQKRNTRYPQLIISRDEWIRFYAIFDENELRRILKRFVALAPLQRVMIENEREIIEAVFQQFQRDFRRPEIERAALTSGEQSLRKRLTVT